jgi:hypothetical protein
MPVRNRQDFDRRKLNKKISLKLASFVVTSNSRFRTDAHNGSPRIASRQPPKGSFFGGSIQFLRFQPFWF